ncbi:helix-turn-helix transcriptional regulator [Streptomyces erythrochromogenes]|uniref:helix-turn-helix domain-containing protein n=1 Tax=Streptomyces erythrochromogenes TaxID=285574 RepID=UPI003426C703
MPEQSETPEPPKEYDSSWVGALMKKLTNRAAGGHERVTKKGLGERLGWLGKRHRGDEKKAAEAAGVSARTFKNWLTGKAKPSAKSLEKLARAEREAMTGLVSGKERAEVDSSVKKVGTRSRDTRVSGGASLSATIEISNDTRPRTIQFGRHLPAGFMDEVRAAFIEGGEQAALAKMEEGLAEHYFGTTQFTITDVEELNFEGIEDPLGDGVGDQEGRYISDVEGPKPGDFLED